MWAVSLTGHLGLTCFVRTDDLPTVCGKLVGFVLSLKTAVVNETAFLTNAPAASSASESKPLMLSRRSMMIPAALSVIARRTV